MAGLRIHTVMPPELVDRIDSAASSAGVSRGEFVRRAVEEALAREESSDRVVAMMKAREKPNSMAEFGAAAEKVFSEPLPDEPSPLNELLAHPRVRSSAAARPFRPAPKKGER